MDENKMLALKVGDTFSYPSWYVNDDMKRVKHRYKCTIMSVIIDNGELHGFTIKLYLKTKRRYSYEFFDVFKIKHECE
jgi:hypothetical protein